MTVFTIGHGNRAIGDFLALLRDDAIEILVDVRARPVSRHHPQFTRFALERSLARIKVRYQWDGEAFGGLRNATRHSQHVALRNASFQAYADHMMTKEFRHALKALMTCAREHRVAIMCAERLPSHCHRALLADSLVVHGNPVLHLLEAEKLREHRLNPAVRLKDDQLIYDRNENLVLDFD